MTDDHNIKSQIHSFILGKFPLARKREIEDDVQLLESGVIDSLGVLDVVAFVERTFAIKIDDDELTPDNFGSIQRLSSFVEQKRARLEVSGV
jgi:acyl carrier protein